jgi:hypothetical protein
MATASIVWTQNGAEAHFGGTDPLAWASNTVKLMILEADFVGSTASFINHASINEIESADISYPAGGYTLANKAVVAAAGPIIKLNADNITDTGVTIEDLGLYIAIYKDTGTPATSRIYGKGTITGTVSPSGGGLTITFTGGTVLQVGS